MRKPKPETTIDELIELLQEAKALGAETVGLCIDQETFGAVSSTYHDIGEVQNSTDEDNVVRIYAG